MTENTANDPGDRELTVLEIVLMVVMTAATAFIIGVGVLSTVFGG